MKYYFFFILHSLSNGGEYITSDQLQRKILSIDKGETCSKSTETNDFEKSPELNAAELVTEAMDSSESEEDTDWSQKSDVPNEKLTEDHLVSAAVDYSKGHLPIVNKILCLSDPNLKMLDHIPFVHRSILHPVLALKILYYKLLGILGEKALPMFISLLRSDLQIFFLILIYAFISSDNAIYVLPMLLYYITFILMICTTFKMLHSRRQFTDYRLWSGLFICYSGGALNAEGTEHLYVRNNLKPYWQFFICLLVNLLTYPIISEQWIPQSELTIVAFLFTFMTLLGFMPKHRTKTIFDPLILLSFAINVLAKYPYEIDPVVAQGWRFLELKVPTFPSYVIGNGIEFCINFKFILYACIPVIFLKIASRQGWIGTFNTLIPHCVTLSWLQIFIISSQGATMFGFLRGTLALVGFVVFLPLLGITSVLLPVIALTKWIMVSNFIYSICIFVILSCIGLGICWICAQTRYKKYTAIIQIILMVLAFLVLINSTGIKPSNEYYQESKKPHILTWEVYQRFCHQPVWQEENVAISQIKCAELEGTKIHWDGYINEVKIKEIFNPYKNIFDRLPEPISQYFYCLYGEEVQVQCDNIPELVKDDCISFYETMKSVKRCSLQKYNMYTFEITLKMQFGIWGKTTEVNLNIQDYFRDFVLKLKPADNIWFKGTLFNNGNRGSDGILGGLKPHIDLEEIGCISCQEDRLTEVQLLARNTLNPRNLLNALTIGFKFILNILLNPILVIK